MKGTTLELFRTKQIEYVIKLSLNQQHPTNAVNQTQTSLKTTPQETLRIAFYVFAIISEDECLKD